MAKVLPNSLYTYTSNIHDEVDSLVKSEEKQMEKMKQEEAEVKECLNKELTGMILNCGTMQTGQSEKLGEVVGKLNMESELVLVKVQEGVKEVEKSNASKLLAIKKSKDKTMMKTKKSLQNINSEEALRSNQAAEADKENTMELVAEIAFVEAKITSGKEEGAAGVMRVEALATALLEEKLKEYQPKGDTPVRKQSSFPRSLIQPVKKEQLVEEVRRRRDERKEKEIVLRQEAAILKAEQVEAEVVKVEEHNESADSGIVSAASARPRLFHFYISLGSFHSLNFDISKG